MCFRCGRSGPRKSFVVQLQRNLTVCGPASSTVPRFQLSPDAGSQIVQSSDHQMNCFCDLSGSSLATAYIRQCIRPGLAAKATSSEQRRCFFQFELLGLFVELLLFCLASCKRDGIRESGFRSVTSHSAEAECTGAQQRVRRPAIAWWYTGTPVWHFLLVSFVSVTMSACSATLASTSGPTTAKIYPRCSPTTICNMEKKTEVQ